MKEKEELLLQNLTDEDIFRGYRQIIEINSEYYATYIIELMNYAIKKSRLIIFKDRLRLILNLLVYKYNIFLYPEYKNEELEDEFRAVYHFIKDFKNFQREFSTLLGKDIYTPEEAADLYLYYFTLLTIYNNIFDKFEDELKKDNMANMRFNLYLPYNATISDDIKTFQGVTKMVRKLKKEDN